MMMRTAAETRVAIVASLSHGPLTVDELASELEAPPFSMRAFLKDLRRDGLVEVNSWTQPSAAWRLTPAGDHAAATWAAERLF